MNKEKNKYLQHIDTIYGIVSLIVKHPEERVAITENIFIEAINNDKDQGKHTLKLLINHTIEALSQYKVMQRLQKLRTNHYPARSMSQDSLSVKAAVLLILKGKLNMKYKSIKTILGLPQTILSDIYYEAKNQYYWLVLNQKEQQQVVLKEAS